MNEVDFTNWLINKGIKKKNVGEGRKKYWEGEGGGEGEVGWGVAFNTLPLHGGKGKEGRGEER